ncbi:hypothetical protein Gotri_025652 [Gossypium trilobum]|uniref:RNase H type-1 domain-containing protein n=1 Tax=Gossypium trilobum TaxID=34281 RepID=A0A7J9FH86_9ROSI|nr:hypothetical protein [Gossypium trilobum]
MRNKPLLLVTPVEKNWMKATYGTVKINFDVSMSMKKIGYGLIARDSDGFVLGGGGIMDLDMHADWEELNAFEESLKFARAFNFPKVLFETDCISLVSRINKKGQDITLLGHHTDEICKQLENFSSSKVSWVNRSCNRITDYLCKQAIDRNCNLTFKLDYPMDIHDLVMKDSIN